VEGKILISDTVLLRYWDCAILNSFKYRYHDWSNIGIRDF
jgi:hypothetical protein